MEAVMAGGVGSDKVGAGTTAPRRTARGGAEQGGVSQFVADPLEDRHHPVGGLGLGRGAALLTQPFAELLPIGARTGQEPTPRCDHALGDLQHGTQVVQQRLK